MLISGIFLCQIFQSCLDLSAEAAGVIHPCPAALAAVCSCEKQDQNAARSTDGPFFLEGIGFKNRSQDILALPFPALDEMRLSDCS